MSYLCPSKESHLSTSYSITFDMMHGFDVGYFHIFCSLLFQSNVENLSPQVIRSVSKELADLVTDAPEGIRIITNEEDITDIQAVIDGPGNTLHSHSNYDFFLRLIEMALQTI